MYLCYQLLLTWSETGFLWHLVKHNYLFLQLVCRHRWEWRRFPSPSSRSRADCPNALWNTELKTLCHKHSCWYLDGLVVYTKGRTIANTKNWSVLIKKWLKMGRISFEIVIEKPTVWCHKLTSCKYAFYIYSLTLFAHLCCFANSLSLQTKVLAQTA